MSADYTILSAKSGVVVTDTNGLAQVIFRDGFSNPTSYSVQLTCSGTVQSVALATNLANTGFTITSLSAQGGGGAGVIRAGVTVYWLAVINSNI
jgi:hypothetical protein